MEFDSDFAILTVVQEALNLVLDMFGSADWERRGNQDWPVWEVEVIDGGKVRVVAAKASDRSNVPAFEMASAVLDAWRPRHLILADIGGCIQGRDDIGVGDLVVGREVEYDAFHKETKEGVERRRYPVAPPTLAPRRALEILAHKHPDWADAIQVPRPTTVAAESPKILTGQIVCSEGIISNPNSGTVKDLVERYGEALAVDTESTGVSRAIYAAQQKKLFAEFCVLRGISDCINDAEGDNQETRDTTKPFAAAVALAAAYTYIRNEPSAEAILNQVAEATGAASTEPADNVASYLDELRAVLSTVHAIGGSSFRLTLNSTSTRAEGSALGEGDAPIERGQVFDLTMNDGLVVVVGKSGTGKSVLLDSIARQLAPGSHPVVVRIDLKSGWSQTWAEGLADSPLGPRLAESMDALLTASSPAIDAGRLATFAQSQDVLLLVDALNEVPPEVAKKIRLTLGQYTRHFNGVRVLATDRTMNPDYAELRWTALALPELDPDEVRRVIDAEFEEGEFDRQLEVRKEILRIPFFLDRAVRDRTTIDFTSRAEAVEGFLTEGGLGSDELDIVGRLALAVLLRGETALSKNDERSLEEDGVLEKLRAGDFLSSGPMGSVFSHQLIHQCLAGRQLAANPELWTPETMDALTSLAASLDGIGMTIASITEEHDRDDFLQIVYDWNWNAAVVALSEAQSGNRAVSEAMEQAILAMVAEKRFDRVEGTRKRVDDLLSKVQCNTAEALRAMSLEELYEYVGTLDHPGTKWWNGWKQVFLRREAAELLTEDSVAQLGSDMPLIGWMVANALRRVDGTEEASAHVRVIYKLHASKSSTSHTIRWRAVHTLGAWPCRANAELLVVALSDEHMWCSYGATRSLVEMAALTDDSGLRDWIVERLLEEWPKLKSEPLSQLARASRYKDVDAEWPATIRPLIEAVRDAQVEEERDRWDRRLADFDRYAAGLEAERETT